MDLIDYRLLWWLAILLPMLWVLKVSLVERPQLLKYLSFALRSLAVIFLVLALCRPFLASEDDQVHVIHLLDVSESVDLEECRKAITTMTDFSKSLRSGDSESFYCFAGHLRDIDPKTFKDDLKTWKEQQTESTFRKDTRIGDALMTVRMNYPAGKVKRLILYSDGQETEGNLQASLDALKKEGVTVEFVPLQGIQAPEASVVSLTSPTDQVYSGEMVRMTAKLSTNTDMNARLRLVSRGVVEQEIPVELKKDGENQFTFRVIMNNGGSSVWSAELIPEKDHFPVNNHSECIIEVLGNPRILVLHENLKKMRHFEKALRAQKFNVELRGSYGMPGSLPEMLDFDAIILANIPATMMSPRQMLNLKKYVVDFGGGLVMMGSENSFGLGGYYKTPVEEVLPIISRYEKEKEKPALSMALVIDKSGSMSGAPIDLARQAAKAAAELLGPQDKVAVIAFDGQPKIICEMASAANISQIHAAIDSLAAGGGTNMYPAMETGREMLASSGTRLKHMIILTDGQSQGGDFHGLATDMASAGITVSTIALGQGAACQLLQEIAELGRGRYYETNDPANVPQIFTKETMEASKSAIKEDPFIPIKVGHADMLSDVDFEESPFLLGYVMTRPKPLAQMQLITEQGDPLLASGRYGLGVSVAFTSDATETWAGEWLNWDGFGKFWAQLLRQCMRKKRTTGLRVREETLRDAKRYIIERKDEVRRPLNNIEWSATVSDGHGDSRDVAVNQVGLGLYETIVPLPELGHTIVKLHDKTDKQLKVLHHQTDYPAEYRLGATLPAEIKALSRFSKAGFFDGLIPVEHHAPQANWLLFAAMAAVLGSVVLRRI